MSEITKHIANNSTGGSGKLSIVATPIGNLRDWTYRAVEVATRADLIACEDTRVTRKLLNHYGVNTKMIAYHEHNAERQSEKIIEMLLAGQKIALMSDAGTPLISDPGYRLVNAAQNAGIAIEAIAGASSITAAMSICGMPTNRFLFMGFLPSKQSARIKELQEVMEVNSTIILFESPNRLSKLLADAAKVMGEREAVIVREITKLHEEVIRGDLLSLADNIKNNPVKGEIVVVISPPNDIADNSKISDDELRIMIEEKLSIYHLKDAVQLISLETNLSRNYIYDMALKIKNQ